MFVELAEVEIIPLKKPQCFQYLFLNTFSVQNSKKRCFELDNICFKPKWNLFWHISFTWKVFGCCWLFTWPASEPKDDFYCCFCVWWMPWACDQVCPGSLAPFVPGGQVYHTLGVNRIPVLSSFLPYSINPTFSGICSHGQWDMSVGIWLLKYFFS